MKEFFKKYWLLCLLLALPIYLFPYSDGSFSVAGTRYQFYMGMRLRVAGAVYVEKYACAWFLIPFWYLVCAGLLKVRLVCLSQKTWKHAFYQSGISFLYLSFIFLFGIFFTRFVWEVALIHAGWEELGKAYRSALFAVPIACCLWPAAILLAMYQDALSLPTVKRIFHYVFMAVIGLLVSGYAMLIPDVVHGMGEMIRLAVEEQTKSFNNEAKAAWEKGKYDEALSYLDKSLKIDIRQPYAYNFRGVILMYFKEDYNKALQEFSRAIERDQKYVFPHTNRGWIYFAKNDYEKAAQDFQKHIELEPASGFAHFKMGVLNYYQGKDQEAAACFARGIAVDPQYKSNYLWKYFTEIRFGAGNKDDLLSIPKDKDNGIALVALFFLDKMTVDEYVDSSMKRKDKVDARPWLDGRLKSGAYFDVAKKYSLEKNWPKAKEYYEKSISHGAKKMSMERLLAEKELKQMK